MGKKDLNEFVFYVKTSVGSLSGYLKILSSFVFFRSESVGYLNTYPYYVS